MKVVIVGGYRTGTTHAYIIARAVLDAAGIAHQRAGVNAETIAPFLETRGPVALKSHYVEVPESKDIWILLCRRNPYDAMASSQRMGMPLCGALEGLRMARRLAAYYKGRRDTLILDYETHYAEPRVKVARIAAHILDAPLSGASIDRIAERTSVGAVKALADALPFADPETELRPHHVGPDLGRPGAYRLSPEIRQAVADLMKGSLDAYR